MNLMAADIENVKRVLAIWGFSADSVYSSFHKGEMSLILEYKKEIKKAGWEDAVRNAIEALTTTTLPIVIIKPEPFFRFNFDVKGTS